MLGKASEGSENYWRMYKKGLTLEPEHVHLLALGLGLLGVLLAAVAVAAAGDLDRLEAAAIAGAAPLRERLLAALAQHQRLAQHIRAFVAALPCLLPPRHNTQPVPSNNAMSCVSRHAVPVHRRGTLPAQNN